MTAVVAVTGFLHDIAAAEQRTPLPPRPDPGDAAAVAAFAAAASARGTAVALVISDWLATAPYVMLQELLDRPASEPPVFVPAVGPAVVVRHDHILRCLQRPDLFTVDPYAAEMARATDDPAKNPGAYRHFMLGTDRDDLYGLDDVILRRVVSRADEATLTSLARDEAERWTAAAVGEIDVAATVARFVPLRIVADYLGVPHQDHGEPSPLPGLCGGDTFPLDDDLARVYTFTRIDAGRVPTADDLYGWIKDAFRNTFNNFNRAAPLFADFRERGVVATEYLTAYIHALIEAATERMRRGEPVPDTMLTRLLRLQADVAGPDASAVERDVTCLLGAPPPDGELARRLSDSMVRSNVFGTVVGAVVNPQEATARIVDSLLRLQDGEYPAAEGVGVDAAAALAAVEEGEPGYPESLEALRRYALEALRLQPQGEVLLRLCVQDNTELGGVLIRKGTPVFVAFAAAMRDPAAVPEPSAFDVCRDEQLADYLSDGVRAHEAPQSRTYLQHGYGRHKCLGRYGSEITMRESVRALLRLGRWERRSALELDDQGLYVQSLRLGVGSGEEDSVKHVLVTGATGFLGYHVVKLLNDRGVRPRVLELPGNDLAPLARLDVERCAGDLADAHALDAACAGVDTLLHLAFLVSVAPGAEVAERMRRVNVEGTRRLLDAAAAAGVTRVVVGGSALAVGVNRKPAALDENASWADHAFDVTYAASRRAAEEEALARSTDDFAVMSTCPAFTLGPDDPVGAPANKLIRALVAGKLPAAPRVGFGCLDVRDFAAGAVAAAERGRPGRRYLLSGHNVTTDDFLGQAAEVAGVRAPRLRPPRWLLQALATAFGLLGRLRGKPPSIDPGLLQIVGRYAWYDTSRARDELGWAPRPLQQTLEDTVAWVRATPASGESQGRPRRRLGRWTAPRPEITVGPSIRFDPATARAIAAVDHSAEFAAGLEHFPSALTGFDDAVMLPGGASALVTGADGQLWTVDTTTHAAQPLAAAPLMAYGIHLDPGNPDRVYFCASRSYGTGDAEGKVGVYRLTLSDRSVELVVHEVPATDLRDERPVVYADDDPAAPVLRPGDDGPLLAVCDNLAVSQDGARLYFSEPFDYTDATVDDALDEAIALAPNGRLWCHDLQTGATRLVAEGFHFVNGVLCDLHPGQDREQSVLVTQTSLFRLTRFHLRGPRAGSAEVVLDGITGMPDGIDRDAAGRIWAALFTERGRLLTFIHEHAWLKPLVLRLPTRLLLGRTRPTGVLVLSPDGREPLWSAMYRGPLLTSVPSAVPTPGGVYLANLGLGGRSGPAGVVRLRWPEHLTCTDSATRSTP